MNEVRAELPSDMSSPSSEFEDSQTSFQFSKLAICWTIPITLMDPATFVVRIAVDPPGGCPLGHMACLVRHGVPGIRNALCELSGQTDAIGRHYGINGYAGYAFDAAALFAQGGMEVVSKGAKFTAEKAEKLVLNYFAKYKCFVSGTLVHTKNGLVPIAEIQVGDWVASRLEETRDGL